MDRLTNFIDRVTKIPGQLQKRGDKLNETLISFSRDLQNAIDNSATTAEKNLTQNKIRSVGSDVASWVSRNLITIGLVAGGLILISVLRK